MFARTLLKHIYSERGSGVAQPVVWYSPVAESTATRVRCLTSAVQHRMHALSRTAYYVAGQKDKCLHEVCDCVDALHWNM